MKVDLGRQVRVIHNWVDTEQFSPATHERNGGARRPLRLLFVGNPSRWKGADLLPALASALGSGFEIRCLGGLRSGFDGIQLPENMKLLPRVASEEMPAIYHVVDAVLIPTRYEAFGYVALEAMACGLPVLGFDSSGTSEVCQKGITALLAPPGDVKQLAIYARRLAGDASLRKQLGTAGRQRAVGCFGEEMALAAYLDVYRRVLENDDGQGHV
jgi:glycosyltransferase involved in cell wall biosynthesis